MSKKISGALEPLRFPALTADPNRGQSWGTSKTCRLNGRGAFLPRVIASADRFILEKKPMRRLELKTPP
jgi:hypothetical protein